VDDEHFCDYKPSLDQNELNHEVELLIMDMITLDGFNDFIFTYEEIKAYVLEHSGLNVSNLYIAQVKQKYGIIERECYNKPKSEDSRQSKCPPEKEAAITEALKYFKMIEGNF